MIFEALSFLSEEINEYFRNKLKIKDDKVVLSSIVDAKGDIAIEGSNKIIITLINIEKETSLSNDVDLRRSGSSAASPLKVNLYLMFSAYFNRGNYGESLRFISFILAYFQHKNVFNHQNSPGLDERIEKLIFDLQVLSQDQLNNVWSSLGAKYMPCVIYKMRMLSISDSIIREYRPLITSIENNPSIN